RDLLDRRRLYHLTVVSGRLALRLLEETSMAREAGSLAAVISHLRQRGALDDLIVVKSDRGQGEVRKVVAKNCVLWNEVAHALSVGAELREDVDDVLFTDCDVIHDLGREWTLRVYHCDSARIRNIRFENIRIEETKRLISLWIGSAVWSLDEDRGHIDHVVFKDIRAVGKDPRIEFTGFSESNAIENVSLINVTINGNPLKPEEIRSNAFVRNVKVVP
ncbi:MAG: hypothetical protein JJ992_07095, partial [Planctomycetes bacterium]|nr:hypothetical protein [Planctomycetota bacterium]